MCTTNVYVVRDCSYENFCTRKFIIQKFVNTKISRSTVYGIFTSHDFPIHVALVLILLIVLFGLLIGSVLLGDNMKGAHN